MDKYTPMMQAYLKTKEQYKDAILFYRLGDFYEMFFEDAKVASRELELVLTGKSCGVEERAPMCGIPYHSAQGYIAKLVERGYKVAICEQVEDPKLAKGIVKREVVRILTPGTYIDSAGDQAIFIAGIIMMDEDIGYALADLSTGEFSLVHTGSIEKTKEEIIKTRPSEIICNNAFMVSYEGMFKNTNDQMPIFARDMKISDVASSKAMLKDQFINFDEIKDRSLGLDMVAAANLLDYLLETQKTPLSHMKHINVRYEQDTLKIDAFTYRNLELIESMRTKEKAGSLFAVLDKTKTAMGRRLLKSSIKAPLNNIEKINERLDVIEELNTEYIKAEKLREILSSIYDLERLITRVSFKNINPKEMLALKGSIRFLPEIKKLLEDTKAVGLNQIGKSLDDIRDVYDRIEACIDEDAPISVRDGGIIKRGYNETVDKLKNASVDGKKWLASLEEREKNATGIKNLRIKYNRVFGYYFEVTNSYLSLVPDYFIRRQTLAGSERYYTEELKEMEDNVLGAKEKLERIEYELYLELLDYIFQNIDRIQGVASLLASLDMMLSLSAVATRNNYVRPRMNSEHYIDIKAGRHPVVEQMSAEKFIENDTLLNDEDNRLYLITGPNMAGKSTYMRQVALICLLAHMGSFVPASAADICILDGIYTRVGASDDLSSGQSTFMVEMNEMAYILKNATKDSLIILDEIGRGTSTYDGLSLAWSIIEYISQKDRIGAKTLFATHYHELTGLEGTLKGIANYSCAVSEQGGSLEFLRKIVRKPADKSYGIQVAQIAGIPDEVINRATQILSSIIEEGAVTVDVAETIPRQEQSQMTFFDMSVDTTEKEVASAVKGFDVNSSTPMEALVFLSRLKDDYNL